MTVHEVTWAPSIELANDDVVRWLTERTDEVAVLERFIALMARELAANANKGNRAGWLQMTPTQAQAEISYHLGKLALAVREVFGDRPPDPRTSGFSADDVDEFGADVANCALMLLDVLGRLGR